MNWLVEKIKKFLKWFLVIGIHIAAVGFLVYLLTGCASPPPCKPKKDLKPLEQTICTRVCFA